MKKRGIKQARYYNIQCYYYYRPNDFLLFFHKRNCHFQRHSSVESEKNRELFFDMLSDCTQWWYVSNFYNNMFLLNELHYIFFILLPLMLLTWPSSFLNKSVNIYFVNFFLPPPHLSVPTDDDQFNSTC